MSLPSFAFEKHYKIKELVAMWGVNRNELQAWFRDEPGVIKLGAERVSTRKRSLISLRVPASVAERVHRRRAG